MSAGGTIVIEARPSGLGARLRSLWAYRSFYPLLLREISMKKFRDTLLGFWWLVLRPLIPTAAIIFIFTCVRPMQTDGVSYPIFFLSGFMTWNVFQATVIFMPRTLLWMQGLMRRAYFPRLLVPLASVGPPLLELAVIGTLFVSVIAGGAALDGASPVALSPRLFWVLPCLVMALMLGMAIGTIISVIALFSRDVVFSVSYFAQMSMLFTPVIYPVSFIPDSQRWLLYVLNPMAQTVELSRWAVTGVGDVDWRFVALAFASITAFFCASLAFFLRSESLLGDEL